MIDEINNIESERQNEQERSARRKKRIEEMRRRKKQQEQIRRLFIPCAAALAVCILLVVMGAGKLVKNSRAPKEPKKQAETEANVSQKEQKSVVNVAGCYVGDIIVDRIAAQIADINALPLQTVGGKAASRRSTRRPTRGQNRFTARL